MTGLQFILGALILFIIYRTLISYKKQSKVFIFLWLSLWILMLFFIFRQERLTSLATLFGIGRGVDLAVYISIISIFYLVYKLFIKLNELEQKITKIVRKLALDDIKKSKKR